MSSWWRRLIRRLTGRAAARGVAGRGITPERHTLGQVLPDRDFHASQLQHDLYAADQYRSRALRPPRRGPQMSYVYVPADREARLDFVLRTPADDPRVHHVSVKVPVSQEYILLTVETLKRLKLDEQEDSDE